MAQIDTIYFGNPIFDITMQDPEGEVQGRYNLESGLACLATPEQMPIYAEAWARADRITGAGGSALNMARAQMHANSSGKVMYFGCIGDDEFGRTLTTAVEESGIESRFQTTTEEPTGSCACVIVGVKRALCANIAAAKKFSMDHLNAHIADLARTKFLYTTGFFIDANAEAVKTIGEYATNNDKILGFNLSAPFVVMFMMDMVKETIKHSEYVFGNEDEASAFAEANSLDAADRVGAAKIIATMEKANMSRPRNVIITQGAEPTIVVTGKPGEEPTV